MKIIYDDIIYSLQRSGGISLYWSQLETYLKQDTHLLYSNCDKNIFFPDITGKKILKNSYIPLERCKNVTLNETSSFIFHSSYYRYCKNENAINITTVHDFTNEYFEHGIKSLSHRIQKRNAINNSKGIICNSENTKRDFLEHYPNYNGDIKVIYNGGYADDYRELGIPKKNTVIFISGRNGYKNFEYAVKLLRKLPRVTLQIIGGGPLTGRETQLLRRCIPGRYEQYQSLSNQELNIKYNEARFLLYPSLYEGLGLPVMEAQAAACPVVCCDVSSLPEVAGGAAVYITGKDIEHDVQKILKLEDMTYYKAIVEKGFENCKRFSWKKCAEETYDFYQEVWDQSHNN
jgi:mannosyltransferase